MELSDLVDVINWDYVRKISDKIDFFASHGVNVRDTKQMGTDFYVKFLARHNQKRKFKDVRVKISKEKAEKIRNFFAKEVNRVVMRRKIDGR